MRRAAAEAGLELVYRVEEVVKTEVTGTEVT